MEEDGPKGSISPASYVTRSSKCQAVLDIRASSYTRAELYSYSKYELMFFHRLREKQTRLTVATIPVHKEELVSLRKVCCATLPDWNIPSSSNLRNVQGIQTSSFAYTVCQKLHTPSQIFHCGLEGHHRRRIGILVMVDQRC